MPGRKYKPGIYSKRATVMVHLTDEMRRRREDKASGLPTVRGEIEGLQEIQAPDVFYDAASTWLSAGPSSSTVATAKAHREDYDVPDIDSVGLPGSKASSLEPAVATSSIHLKEDEGRRDIDKTNVTRSESASATASATPAFVQLAGSFDSQQIVTTHNFPDAMNLATDTSAGMMEALWQIFDAVVNPQGSTEIDQEGNVHWLRQLEEWPQSHLRLGDEPE